MIIGHRWRPRVVAPKDWPGPPWPDRPCAYWGCGQARADHQRTVNEPSWGNRRLSS